MKLLAKIAGGLDTFTKAMSYVSTACDYIESTLKLPDKARELLTTLVNKVPGPVKMHADDDVSVEQSASDVVSYLSVINYLPKQSGTSATEKYAGCVVEQSAIQEISHELKTILNQVKTSLERTPEAAIPCNVIALSEQLDNILKKLHAPKALKAYIDFEQLQSKTELLNGSGNILENEIEQCLRHVMCVIENNIIRVERVQNKEATGMKTSKFSPVATGTMAQTPAIESPSEGNEEIVLPLHEDKEQKKKIYNVVSMLYCVMRYGGTSLAEDSSKKRNVAFATVLESLKAFCDSPESNILMGDNLSYNLNTVLYDALEGKVALDSYPDAQEILTRYLQDISSRMDAPEVHIPTLIGNHGSELMGNIASTIFYKVVELDNAQQEGAVEQLETPLISGLELQRKQSIEGAIERIITCIGNRSPDMRRLISIAPVILANSTVSTLNAQHTLSLLKMLRSFLTILKHASPTMFPGSYHITPDIEHVSIAITRAIRQQESIGQHPNVLVTPKHHEGLNVGNAKKSTRKVKTILSTSVVLSGQLKKITRMNCLVNEVFYLLKKETLYSVILHELKRDTEIACYTEALEIGKFDEKALARVAYGISRKTSLLLSQDLTVGVRDTLKQVYELSKDMTKSLHSETQYLESDDSDITDILERLTSLDKVLTSETCSDTVDVRLFHIRVLVEGCIAVLFSENTESGMDHVCRTLNRTVALASDIWGEKHTMYLSLQDCARSVHEIWESKKKYDGQDTRRSLLEIQYGKAGVTEQRPGESINVAIANTLLKNKPNDRNNDNVQLIPVDSPSGYEIHEFEMWVSKLSELGSEALLHMSSLPTMVHSPYPLGYASTARPSLLGLCPSNWEILEQTSCMLSLLTLLLEDLDKCTDKDVAQCKRHILNEGINGLRISRNDSFTRHNNYVLMIINAIIGSVNKVSHDEDRGLLQLNNFAIDDVYFKFAIEANEQYSTMPSPFGETISSASNDTQDINEANLPGSPSKNTGNKKGRDYRMLEIKARSDFLISPGLGSLIKELQDFLEGTILHVKEDRMEYGISGNKEAFLADIHNALDAVQSLNEAYITLRYQKKHNEASAEERLSSEAAANGNGEKNELSEDVIQQKLIKAAECAFSSISHAKMVGPAQKDKIVPTFLNSAAAIATKIMSEAGQLALKTNTRELCDSIECTKRFISLLEAALRNLSLSTERNSSTSAFVELIREQVSDASNRLEYVNVNDLISEYSVAHQVNASLLDCLKELYDLQYYNEPSSDPIIALHNKAAIKSCRAACYLLPNLVPYPRNGTSNPKNIAHGLSHSEICAILVYEAMQKIHEISGENLGNNLESLRNYLSDIAVICMSNESYFTNPSVVAHKLQKAYKLCVEILEHNTNTEGIDFLNLQKATISISRALGTLGISCKDLPIPSTALGACVYVPPFPGETKLENSQALSFNVENDGIQKTQRHSGNFIFVAINSVMKKILKWIGIKTKGRLEYSTVVTYRINAISERLSELQHYIDENTGNTTNNAHILEMAREICGRSMALAAHAINSENLTDTLEASCHLIGSRTIVQKAAKTLSGKRVKSAVGCLQVLGAAIADLQHNLRKSATGKMPALHTLENPNYRAFGGMVHSTDAFITHGVFSAALWNSDDPVSELKNTIKKIRRCYPKDTKLNVSPNIFHALFIPHKSFGALDVICENCSIKDNDSGELQAVLDIFAQNIEHYDKRSGVLEVEFSIGFWKRLISGNHGASHLLTRLIENSCIKKEIGKRKKYLVPCDLDKIIESLSRCVDGADTLNFLLNNCYGGTISEEALLRISTADHIRGRKKAIIEDFINNGTHDHIRRGDKQKTAQLGFEELAPGRHYMPRVVQYKETCKTTLWSRICNLYNSEKVLCTNTSGEIAQKKQTPQSRIETNKNGDMFFRGRSLRVISEMKNSAPVDPGVNCTRQNVSNLSTQTHFSGTGNGEITRQSEQRSSQDTHEHFHNLPQCVVPTSTAHTQTSPNGFSARILHDISVEESNNNHRLL